MAGVGEITETLEVEWEINTADVLKLKPDEEKKMLRSPPFNFACQQWSILIYPNDTDDKGVGGYLSCYLEKTSSSIEPLRLQFEISIFTCGEIIRKGIVHHHTFSKASGNWGWKCFIKNFRNVIASQKIFKICCKVRAFNSGKESLAYEKAREQEQHGLYYDLKSLINDNEEYCTDVVLKACGGEEFRAHKCILMARSEVFKTMLSTDMKEAEENVVEIADMDSGVVKNLLQFIYTDECLNLEDSADGLLIAAEKYMLYKLKKMCVSKLLTTMSPDNAIPRLFLGLNNNTPELKAGALKFIENNFKLVQASSHWQTIFQYPDVAIEVCNLAVSLIK